MEPSPQPRSRRETVAFDIPSSYLFVSARDPIAAAEAVARWADGPPDLCVTSPSEAARKTGAFACGDRGIPILDEPLLAGRYRGESAAAFGARNAEALRTLNAFDTRAALVVWDDLSQLGDKPVVFEGRDLLRSADAIDGRLPPL